MDDSFSQAIKDARNARGWTQEDLAKQLGVSQQSVQKWEAGKSMPRQARQVALMRALSGDERQYQGRQEVVRHVFESAPDGKILTKTITRSDVGPRLSVQTKSSALMAALEEALPDAYKDNLEPPNARNSGFRFAADYLSPNVAAEILRAPKRGVTTYPDRCLQKLWDLSTLRQIDMQSSGGSRVYLLVIIADDAIEGFEYAAKWRTGAELHGINITIACNPDDAAEEIVKYETGEKPYPEYRDSQDDE